MEPSEFARAVSSPAASPAAGSPPPAEGGNLPVLLVGLLTLQVAGAERIALELVRGVKDEYRIRVAAVRDPSHRPSLLPEGTPVGGLRELLFGRADLIHTHLFLPGLVARIRRIWDRRTPWVHTVHYHNYGSALLAGFQRWLDHRFIFPAADELVAVSPVVGETLRRHPNHREILNAVTLAEDRGGSFEGAGEPVVGSLGMFRSEKDPESLVRTAALLGERVPGVKVRIAGDGPERKRLENLVRELGVEGTVDLVGYVGEPREFYRSLDVYVQPSRNESFGLAVLEALSHGLPVVAARVGFLSELLGDGRFGLLVERGEGFEERLADGVEKCLAEREKWSERAREGALHWRDRLSSEAMVGRYRELYRSLRTPGVCMLAPVVTEAVGGLQRQLELQTRALAALGWRVYVLQRGPRELLADPDLRERWDHVRFLLTPPPRILRPGPGRILERLRGLRYVVSALRLLRRYRHRIRVLHAHQLYSPTLAGALAKRVVGGPLVTKVTAAGPIGEASELGRLPFFRIREWAFRRVDRVIVLHAAMAQEVEALGFSPDRIVEVPNAVSVPPEPATIRPLDPGEVFRLLFVGRLSTEKGLELLVEAAGILAQGGIPVRVELVGRPDSDRDAEPALQELARSVEEDVPAGTRSAELATPEIGFLGHRDDVGGFYQAGPVFVLPSRSEGMSNSLLEAMSWGLPVVVSNIASNRALVEDGVTGLLFSDGDAGSLAEVLSRVHRDLSSEDASLAQEIGTGARRLIRERFSEGVVGRRLAELYEEVLEAGRS